MLIISATIDCIASTLKLWTRTSVSHNWWASHHAAMIFCFLRQDLTLGVGYRLLSICNIINKKPQMGLCEIPHAVRDGIWLILAGCAAKRFGSLLRGVSGHRNYLSVVHICVHWATRNGQINIFRRLVIGTPLMLTLVFFQISTQKVNLLWILRQLAEWNSLPLTPYTNTVAFTHIRKHACPPPHAHNRPILSKPARQGAYVANKTGFSPLESKDINGQFP